MNYPSDTSIFARSRIYHPLDLESFRQRVNDFGASLVNGVLDESGAEWLRRSFPENVLGVHNLLDRPLIRELACSEPVRRLAVAALGEECFAVRGVFLSGMSDRNPATAFHQNVTIEVAKHCNAPGFSRWTVMCGVQHVQAPASILSRMLSVTLHLDDSTSYNGPLKVFLGSHLNGDLSEQELERIVKEEHPAECLVSVGGALVTKPLLVRGSGPAVNPRHRRVIHLDYAAEELPYGLQWHQRVRP
jgi:hypothetical protein